MDVKRKIDILADAAKYDASCSSSGSARAAGATGLGSTALGGICHSWSADGRCISLLDEPHAIDTDLAQARKAGAAISTASRSLGGEIPGSRPALC